MGNYPDVMSLSYRSLGLSLLIALGLTACEPNGGNRIVRQSGGAGFIDAQETMVQFECSCVGELEGLTSEEACFDDYTAELEEADAIGECIDRALADHPSSVDPFECMLGAQYDMLECAIEVGCNTFTCDDGTAVHDTWVCDGEADCAGGEDELQSCPAPHQCDGGEVSAAWICDGYEDCADGSDEPADCQLDCIDEAFLAFDACPEPSEAFMEQIDDCFGTVVVSEGDSIDECPDGDCATTEPPPALRMATSKDGPRRSRAALRATRHVLAAR